VRRINQTAVILGAGFSKAADLPTTVELGSRFLNIVPSPVTTADIQQQITLALERFWTEVFGYRPGQPPPSFEDHFTALDLSANSGHQLGSRYSPAQLRAIRRLSLHRVFDILNSPGPPADIGISQFVQAVAAGSGNTIITTNWDIVVENRLFEAGLPYHHGIPMRYLTGPLMESTGLELLKLHGSTHWLYCDSCRRVFSGRAGDPKAALHSAAFLESRDFTALGLPNLLVPGSRPNPECPCCEARLSARVATFSYSKALGFYQFQGVWEAALRRLQQAKKWLFIGYSLPEADFELRHLLKTAELSRMYADRPNIQVVLYTDKPAVDRYRRFFGISPRAIRRAGFHNWWFR
jgi:hypothetical protein